MSKGTPATAPPITAFFLDTYLLRAGAMVRRLRRLDILDVRDRRHEKRQVRKRGFNVKNYSLKYIVNDNNNEKEEIGHKQHAERRKQTTDDLIAGFTTNQ